MIHRVSNSCVKKNKNTKNTCKIFKFFFFFLYHVKIFFLIKNKKQIKIQCNTSFPGILILVQHPCSIVLSVWIDVRATQAPPVQTVQTSRAIFCIYIPMLYCNECNKAKILHQLFLKNFNKLN